MAGKDVSRDNVRALNKKVRSRYTVEIISKIRRVKYRDRAMYVCMMCVRTSKYEVLKLTWRA